jgi:hypothetical protein
MLTCYPVAQRPPKDESATTDPAGADIRRLGQMIAGYVL